MEFLRVNEVVARLGGKVSKGAVYGWVKGGKVKAVKAGGVVLIHADSLREFLSRPAVGPEPAPCRTNRKAPGRDRKIRHQDCL